MTDSPRAVYALAEFKTLLPAKGRLVGLDVGTETIGVAVSDASRMVASPNLTIYRRKWSEDCAALSAMMEGQDIAGFVRQAGLKAKTAAPASGSARVKKPA